MNPNERTLGEICAGISGFGAGFEQAGWKTLWQIELDDVNRAVLGDRFPWARQFKDLRDWRSFKLPRVDCIAFGSPCQDISVSANVALDQSRRGLEGQRSSLFFPCMEIVGALQPDWVVFENVPSLLYSNDCKDFQRVIQEFAKRGYVGFARVLDAQYFGIPQKRRRLFVAAGLGKRPSMEYLGDAGTVESLPCSISPEQGARLPSAFAGYTLMAPDKLAGQNSRICLASELFIAHEDGWDQMAERARAVELHGLRPGLDATNAEEAYAAGNAVPPPIAKWIAEILNRS